MISPKDFIEALKAKGFLNLTGVPCSFFQAAINYALDQKDLRYTMVPNEGSALALASGSYLAGKPCVLFIQNSGLGNLVNPLTSLNMIYDIPVLLFISGRAYGVKDEPQHEIIGKTMGPVLDAMGVAHEDMPVELSQFKAALENAMKKMAQTKQPFVFFVKKDTIEECGADKAHAAEYPLKRIDAIRIIDECLSGRELVIATTGKPSRELFSVHDRPGNFYMQGSMGHAAAIGLGVAIASPGKKVVVLDGDGALLMHMGILSSIGHDKPKNLYHIVLDNEAYETTGDQDTTSRNTAFEKIALDCGYAHSFSVKDEQTLRTSMKALLATQGPSFLRIKINRIQTADIPRISSKHSSKQITARFMETVR